MNENKINGISMIHLGCWPVIRQRKPGTPTVISAARRAVDCVDYISFGKPESHTSNWLAAKTAIINKKQQKCQKS